MELAKNRSGIGAGAAVAAGEEQKKNCKRGHGSTTLFMAVDYAFLLAFAGFLSYLLVSHLLPSITSSASAA